MVSLIGSPILAVVGIVLAIVLATAASRPVSADVARAVVPEVSRQVYAEQRVENAAVYRQRLGEANLRLATRGLPVIADPGPTASSPDVLGAWITARVLGALPASTTDQLRLDVAAGRTPRVLPSMFVIEPNGVQGDTSVTVLPEPVVTGATPRPPDAPTVGPSSPVAGQPSPSGRPAPAPTTTRPLLPLPVPLPGLPVPIPLLGG